MLQLFCRVLCVFVLIHCAFAFKADCSGSFFGLNCNRYSLGDTCTNKNVESFLNVTFDYSKLYGGGTTNITAKYTTDESDAKYYYLFCYKSAASRLTKQIACRSSNHSNVTVLWELLFSANVTVYVSVYDINTFISPALACVRTNITVGTSHEVNVSVLVTEKNHNPSYSNFFPGNITFNVSIDMPNTTNLLSANSSNILYTYRIDFWNLSSNSTFTVVIDSNTSLVNYTYHFDKVGVIYYTVESLANDTRNHIAYVADLYVDILNISEQVKEPAVTVNNNVTASPGISVNVSISANGSLPINVCWNLTFLNSPRNSSVVLPIHPSQTYFTCNSTVNCTTIRENRLYFFNCTFNSNGDYQISAFFNNSASEQTVLYNFSISGEGPTAPPAVVLSASAVITIVTIGIMVVVVIVIISSYISYRKYHNRFTETADFRFVHLRRHSHWEHLKSNVQEWRNSLLRRKSKVGLVNPDEFVASYESVKRFEDHESF